MLRTIADFKKNWEYEAEMTGKVLRLLTDVSLGQMVNESGRDLGFLAWHLSQTLREMLEKVGLTVDAPAHDAPRPDKASEIADSYDKAAASLIEQVTVNWNDDTLLQKDEMYGETWERGLTLFYVITHQAHHRGQMTVLMRQAGLPVPGVYGPSKEEWEAFGMPALA
jgi:uncharacterized damage-inducible protein DinB